jgi:hypothetical protein
MKPTYYALLIGLVLGIPIGLFVSPVQRYEFRTYGGKGISGRVFRIDNRAGTIEVYIGNIWRELN